MIIRNALENDSNQVKNLLRYTFGYSESFLDWSIQRKLNKMNNIVVDDNGKIISSAFLVPYTINVRKEQIPCSYLSSVAILPEKKTDDILKETLKAVVDNCDKNNQIVSLAIPNDYKFYEKFGWRTCYMYKQMNIELSSIPLYAIKGQFDRITLAYTDYSKLDYIYNKFVSDRNGYVNRSNENWSAIIEDLIVNFAGNCVILHDTQNNPVGYLMYLMHDDTMMVYEMAYVNRMAYESMMAFIKNHDMQITKVEIKTPMDDLSYLDYSNMVSMSVYPFMMARVTNIKKALEIQAKDFSNIVNIQIIDRLVSDVNVVYKVENGEVTETTDNPDVVTDIGTFTQLFMGMISIYEASQLELISGDNNKLLGLFYKQNNYINMLIV